MENNKNKPNMKISSPNDQKHRNTSFVKSFVRIVGYILIPYYLPLAISILVISELIGVIEELV